MEMYDMNKKLNDIKIGLVLAGGGAKGAYEVGVYKALRELEIVDNIKVISGTSIGSINALFFAMDNPKVIGRSWRNLNYSRFILNQQNTKEKKSDLILEKIKSINIENGIFEQVNLNDIGLLSQSGIKDFIEEYIDMEIIKNSDKELYACAYNVDKERPEYFRLNDCTEEEIKDRVLASSAIPHMFKPIHIDGMRYSDGGIHSPLYSKNNIDNVPIAPLRNYECDIIIVVHLSNKSKVDKTGFEGTKIIEIYPSSSLEIISGIGGLNLRKDTIEGNIELGYRDAMVQVAPLIVKILKGYDI